MSDLVFAVFLGLWVTLWVGVIALRIWIWRIDMRIDARARDILSRDLLEES